MLLELEPGSGEKGRKSAGLWCTRGDQYPGLHYELI